MQTTFALAALASVAYALPQGAPSGLAPSAASPAGCSQNYDGEFQITIVNASSVAKREISSRQSSTCGQSGFLTAKLSNGELTDAQGRIGSIVANYQFQFDGPPAQAGALYTAGFSVCSNGSLALGGSAVFYSCQSGEDPFSNLYDRSWQPACKPIYIDVIPCGAGGTGGQQSDGQLTATTSVPPVSQIGDGQPQATSAVAPPVTQITDGQLQGATSAAAPITQISDGQIQGPTTAAAPAVTQISDGQLQAPTVIPTAAPVSQISDGQVQAPTSAPAVSQISDGQLQAPTVAPTVAPTASPVSQISDGQVQAPTTAAPPAVTQIGDGQLQGPVNASAPAANTSTPVYVPANAGNGLNVAGSMVAVVFGLVAVLLL